jgi:iron complex outermembrane receptor protein
MLVWGDMPIEYIDHIEVYRGASSIEFGNEPGQVVIKLYTKKPEREEGGKLRLLADDKRSHRLDAYYAHTFDNELPNRHSENRKGDRKQSTGKHR